jgi:hypothetical protein
MTASKARSTALAPLIDSLPEDWALTAVDGHKRPIDAKTGWLMDGWQVAGQSRELLTISTHAKAVGAICGPLSGGLVVIDFDGPLANATLQTLTDGFGEDDLPPTVACSSGRPSRKKLFFTVADRELWPLICGFAKSKERPDLEILWTGRQAVAIGAHPEMPKGYFWLDGCSPNDVQVAEAPAWLIDPLIDANENDAPINFAPSSIEHIAEIINFLNPDDFGDYESWAQLGMACKIEDPSEQCKQLFDEFSRKAPKYNEKFLNQQWKAWSTMEEFKQKRPNSRPKTLASFAPMAIANGMKPQKPSKASSEGERLEAIVREQTDEKLLDDARKAPNMVNLLAFLRHQKDCSIRWNDLRRFIVIDDDETIDAAMADVFLADKWKICASDKNAKKVLLTIARENSFNPIAEYFEQLRNQDLPLVSDEQLADCFGFDSKDNLSIQLMRVHLRACVDRGLRPGGKMDSLLVIKGEQGHGKSSALQVLTPIAGAYDETTRVNFDSRDSLSALNSAYIYEFSEIEKILTTADVAQFKSWITRENDKYVEKFEHECKDHPRRCCLFGTTNAASFLMDPTGARRFFICENVKPANLKLLKQLKDAIWRQSLIELDNGEAHFLTNDSTLFIEGQERAQNATMSDPWEAEISSYLSNCKVGDFVTGHQLLKQLNKPMDKLDMRDFKRIGNIMKRLQWIKARRRQTGFLHAVDGYSRPKQTPLTEEERNQYF